MFSIGISAPVALVLTIVSIAVMTALRANSVAELAMYPPEVVQHAVEPPEPAAGRNRSGKSRRTPHDVVALTASAPHDVVAIAGAPHDVVAVLGAPHDVVAVAGAPDDVVDVVGAPDDVI